MWRAEDLLDPGAWKALKLVGVATASATQLERLRREARQLVQLQHPSLVACHALFEDLRRGLAGVVMDYADGAPLDAVAGDPSLPDRARWLLPTHVAGALAIVHGQGVVHRDVKLENVVVTRGFRADPTNPATVKLIDFDIAIETDDQRRLTQEGHVIGTLPYLAPELLDPSAWAGGGRATPASDVFAFGVLAWKLLMRSSGGSRARCRRSGLLRDRQVRRRPRTRSLPHATPPIAAPPDPSRARATKIPSRRGSGFAASRTDRCWRRRGAHAGAAAGAR